MVRTYSGRGDIWNVLRSIRSIRGVKPGYSMGADYTNCKKEFGFDYKGISIRVQGKYVAKHNGWDIKVSVHSDETRHFAEICSTLEDLV